MNRFNKLLFIFLIYTGNIFGFSHYETLGLQPSSSQEEIKKAYQRLAMKTHPDRGGTAEEFRQVREAYEILGDVHKRAVYDRLYHSENNSFHSKPEETGGFTDGFEFNTSGFTHGSSFFNFDEVFKQAFDMKGDYGFKPGVHNENQERDKFTFGYQFNYGPGFFHQYEPGDSLEQRKNKEQWNALKVLEWHSHTPFAHLKASWDNIETAYTMLKWWHKDGILDQMIFTDINRSYDVLYEYTWQSQPPTNRTRPNRTRQKQNLNDLDSENLWGRWILIAALLFFAASGNSMEMEPLQVIQKPSVVEYIQKQKTPLEQTDCSFVFTK